MSDEQTRNRIRQSLADLFAGYRAEWLAGRIYTLFTEPAYFPQLVNPYPCFLVGGRGTGKTTALQCLSYQGMLAMRGDEQPVAEWPHYGFYYRVNTNRVNAFKGPELAEERWEAIFAHYINLEFCTLALSFIEWYGAHAATAPRLSADSLTRIALTLNLGDVRTHGELARALEHSRLKLEASINNIGSHDVPPLSLQGAAVDQMMRELKKLDEFSDKSFFFLIDEYENLESLQQRVINTLVKHCGDLYSFKIGVREFGLRERSTVNRNEQLSHPADYKRIDITDTLVGQGVFSEFAADVCNLRLQRAFEFEATAPDVKALLPGLTVDEEAFLLGIDQAVLSVRQEAATAPVAEPVKEWLLNLPALELYALASLATSRSESLADRATGAHENLTKWAEHFENYKHAYLFTIKRGKRGIRKYYCGWQVFCRLASGNIRFLLELLDESLTRHLADDGDLGAPISPEHQTKAAQETGNKNLKDLEGVVTGAELARLLLGLGRVFQVMAESSIGHTPEANQFHLGSPGDDLVLRGKVEDLLREGVMHLALIRYRGSKLQDDSDIRQWDYAIHPIYAPFFGFSHRRKRKIDLSDKDILGLLESPNATIRAILTSQNRESDEALPEQMQLFARYYALQD